MITFTDVSLSFLGKNLLENINFQLNSKEKVGLIGRNGSGKSTLLNLVNRLYDVNEGKVIIDGNNVKDFKLNRLRSLIGNI